MAGLIPNSPRPTRTDLSVLVSLGLYPGPSWTVVDHPGPSWSIKDCILDHPRPVPYVSSGPVLGQ